MVSNKTHDRIVWLDILRIFAIFMVVATHTLFLKDYVQKEIITTTLFTIVPTCVPIFVMISGALLLPGTEGVLTFYKKRFAKILPAWTFWVTFYILFEHALGIHLIPEGNPFVFVVQKFLSRLWFLPLIFYLYLVTPWLRAVANKSKVFLPFVCSMWVLFITHLFVNALHGQGFNVPLLIQFTGYYILGHLLAGIKQSKTVKYLSFAGIFLTMGIGGYLATYTSLVPDFYFFNYMSPTTVILSCFVFIFAQQLFGNPKTFTNKKLKNLLTLASLSAFGIYLIHESLFISFTFLFHDFNSYMLDKFTIPYTILSVIALFLVSFFFVYLIRKSRLGRLITP